MPDRIVELDGVQHHFPGDATDAEIASALHGSAPKPSYGMFPTDEQKARLAPEPDWKSNLAGALEPMAHPKTAGDFTGLLIPSGGGAAVMKALEPVGAAVSKYGGAAAKLAGAAASTMMPHGMAPIAKSALAVLGELKPSEWNSPLTVAGREGRAHAAVADQVERFRPNTGGMPTSATVEPRGRVPYAPPTPSATTSTPTAAAGPLSDLELAQQEVAAGRLPKSALSAIERAQTPARPPITVSPDSPMQPPPVNATSQPSSPRVANMPTPTELPPQPNGWNQAVADLYSKASEGTLAHWADSSDKAISDVAKYELSRRGASSSMQQPRVQIGAEAVGRQNGLTTQQVRDTTGPIRGEAPGTAAGMPSKPMDRIVQKLIDMGPKGQGLPESAREAYAAAGTSDKTRVQVQAYLDALRKVGFAAPFAAGPALMRDAMMKALGQGDQQQ